MMRSPDIATMATARAEKRKLVLTFVREEFSFSLPVANGSRTSMVPLAGELA